MSKTIERISLRFTALEMERIAYAAKLSGIDLSRFVRLAALREADRLTMGEQIMMLPSDQIPRLLAALQQPFSPNARLKKSFARVRSAPSRQTLA